MSLIEYQAQINSVLRQEIDLSNKLLDTLQSENQALSNNNFDAMQQTAFDKQQIIDTLDSLGRQRESLLRNAGYSGDKVGMYNFIRQGSSDLDKNWQQLVSIASKCRRQNEINGIIISAASRHTTNALRMLKGQQPSEKVRYGSKGEAISSSCSNPIAKA